MRKIRVSAVITLGWGVLSLAALLVRHLALSDIGHGEGDLELEWIMLRAGLVTVWFFHLPALATAYLTLSRRH